MPTTLVKHGDSYALVIDQSLLDVLHINPDTPLECNTDGKSLIVTPSNDEHEERFRAAVDNTIDKYGNMLKRLAE